MARDIFDYGLRDITKQSRKNMKKIKARQKNSLKRCVLNLELVKKNLYRALVDINGEKITVTVDMPTVEAKKLGYKCKIIRFKYCNWTRYDRCEVSGEFKKI